jgi:hypothetical protein
VLLFDGTAQQITAADQATITNNHAFLNHFLFYETFFI